MPRTVARLLLVAAVSTIWSCGEPGSGSGADSAVVARYAGAEITAADLDARVLGLPPAERPAPGEDLQRWYQEQVREMVVDRLLLVEARERGLADETSFRAARRAAEKQIGLQLCLVALAPETEAVTEADLRAAYERRADELSVPERRSVYHIFLRRGPGARDSISSLRDRVLAGEGFSRLAEEHSESETRHRRGFVGWVHPRRLPAGFERVVYALEEGVPSEPVATREGFHLFYVDQVLPARELGFDEARPILRQRLQVESRDAALAELDAGIAPPAGALVLDRERFTGVVREGNPEAPVLRLGEEEWTLADVRGRVRGFLERPGVREGAPTVELAWQILDQARRREEIYLHCRSEERIAHEALAERLGAWEDRALVEVERHRRLVALAEEDEERLRLFYESNVGDFSTPPRWTVRILRTPLGRSPQARMARLEAAASEPCTDLDTLRDELEGEIERLEPMSLPELRRLQPKLPGLIAPLGAGSLSAPYRTEDGLEMAQVVARIEATPIPFEDVRERVASRYVGQYTADLYDRLRRRMIDQADLELDTQALAALRDAGLPRPDVSVEELEALLGGD